MHFDGPVVAWLTLALLPMAVPLVLAIILRQLFGSSGCLPLVILMGMGVAIAFGLSFYLGSLGQTVKGQVMSKKESVIYHPDGSWDRSMVVDISYDPEYGAPPKNVTLSLAPARFDALIQGDFVNLRIPNMQEAFRVTRLEDEQILTEAWDWLTSQPFLLFFSLGCIALLAVRFAFRTSLPTLFFFGGFVIIAAWWADSVGRPLLQTVGTLFGSLNTSGATVREIHPLLPGNGFSGWIADKLSSPSELILFDLIPAGHSDILTAVDQVDAGSAAFRPGQSVTIEYSASDPRIAISPDVSRSYAWKNGLIDSFLALFFLAGIGRIAFLIRERRAKGSETLRSSKRRRRQARAL